VSLSALKALIIHMGSLKEGRKALIVVSEGYTNALPPQMRNPSAQFPGYGNPNAFNPGAGANDPNEDRYRFFSNVDLESDLREVFDTANRNNVAIYAVDPRGLPGFEFDIDQNVGSLQVDSQYLNATMNTLRELAENTDGRAIVNRNEVPRNQGPGEAAGCSGPGAKGLLGVDRGRNGKGHRAGKAGDAQAGRGRARGREPAGPRGSGADVDRHVERGEWQDPRDVRLGTCSENAGRECRIARRGGRARLADGRRS
jgi:hypothetical protein